MIEDALTTTRNLHRLLLAASAVVIATGVIGSLGSSPLLGWKVIRRVDGSRTASQEIAGRTAA